MFLFLTLPFFETPDEEPLMNVSTKTENPKRGKDPTKTNTEQKIIMKNATFGWKSINDDDESSTFQLYRARGKKAKQLEKQQQKNGKISPPGSPRGKDFKLSRLDLDLKKSELCMVVGVF